MEKGETSATNPEAESGSITGNDRGPVARPTPNTRSVRSSSPNASFGAIQARIIKGTLAKDVEQAIVLPASTRGAGRRQKSIAGLTGVAVLW